MAPTVYREGPFRFFFNSREETRMHVHVQHPDGVAKFWLAPAVELASQHGIRASLLAEMESIVKEHADEFIKSWRRHFDQ